MAGLWSIFFFITSYHIQKEIEIRNYIYYYDLFIKCPTSLINFFPLKFQQLDKEQREGERFWQQNAHK